MRGMDGYRTKINACICYYCAKSDFFFHSYLRVMRIHCIAFPFHAIIVLNEEAIQRKYSRGRASSNYSTPSTRQQQ